MSEWPPDRSPRYRIAPLARLAWETHEVPHAIEEVVEAIFRRPAPARNSILILGLEPRIHMVPAVEVLGHRFMVFGQRDAEGRWLTFQEVRPYEHR